MKKAIWLDDRERYLSREICDYANRRMKESLDSRLTDNTHRLALYWTISEIESLRKKFEEPPTETEGSGTG